MSHALHGDDVLFLRGRHGRLECAWLGPAPGEAPSLVFLHDGLGSLGLWRDFPARLAERLGCGALVFGRAGHGGSQPAPLPRGTAFMHEEARLELPPLLEQLDLREHALVGHSDGGSIALLHAALAPRPGLRAVVTLAAHVFCEPLTRDSIAAARAEFEAGPLRRRLERHHGPNTEALFQGWSGAWLAPEFERWDLRPELGAVRVPVLALQGADDEYGTARQLDGIAGSVGGPVHTELLPGCGHTPHRDRPDAVLARLETFLRPLLF